MPPRVWLLNPPGVVAHGLTSGWPPGLAVLHIGSDAAIGLACFSIPLTLIPFARQRRAPEYGRAFHLIVALLLALGATHLMAILTVRVPVYGVEGLIKLAAALLSIATAVILWSLIPRPSSAPSPVLAQPLTGDLAEYAIERARIASLPLKSEVRTRSANRELERQVSEQTAELRYANLKLTEAIAGIKGHEEELGRRNAELDRLATIVEFSDDAILSKSLDGVITSWNSGAETLLGYSAEEAIGQSAFSLIPDSHVEEEKALLDRIRGGGRADHFETLRKRKDGTVFDVSVTLSPIRDRQGNVIGASSIARSIVEMKRRDAELRRSNADLEQFAYVASHDLQEPLRMVASYTELLAERYRGQLDDKADIYIQFASDGARRMQCLIADLLAYSRIGAQAKALAPVDCKMIVASTVELFAAQLDELGATVHFRHLPIVRADEGQLRQLFQNLIGNAIKFRSDEPLRISVTARHDRDHWAFSVSDNGIGIDTRHAGRIFGMFQRLHERGRFEGSGIGLAIAKRIVELHGGQISVVPAPTHGSTFQFTLPDASGRTEPFSDALLRPDPAPL